MSAVLVNEAVVASLSWQELARLHADVSAADPVLRDLLERLADERDAQERSERTVVADDADSPACLPSLFGGMKAWALEQFAQYEALQYDRALVATNGQLLNERGRRLGIDSRTLFRGPVARVVAYGSDELNSFFGQNGRLGVRAFRYTLFRWPSDRRYWLCASVQDFGHVPQIEQPSW